MIGSMTRIAALLALVGLSTPGCGKTEPSANAQPPHQATTPPPAPPTAPPVEAVKAPEPPPPAPVEAPKPVEVVFDPRTPPPGWMNCHRNHCHNVDGRVGSYAQVMQEMGATKMVGATMQGQPPAAPPDVAAPPADAQRTASGLAFKVLRPGTGSSRPGPTSVVTAHYTGWTTDGKPFDSSVQRGAPAKFPLNRVIPGWTEGLQLMVQGEERRFWIPSELAYNNKPGRPQGMLIFDVELISFTD